MFSCSHTVTVPSLDFCEGVSLIIDLPVNLSVLSAQIVVLDIHINVLIDLQVTSRRMEEMRRHKSDE